MNYRRLSGTIFALTLVAASAARASAYVPIADYGPDWTVQAFGINDAGWVTGAISRRDQTSTVGFVRSPTGTVETFSYDPRFTSGRGIASDNRVIGFAGIGFSRDQEFIRAVDGSITILRDPADGMPLHGIAQGINGHGVIVGDETNRYGTRAVA